MHVVLGVERDVEVHDPVDVGHVDAAAHDIGGHKCLELAGTEAVQRAFALLLGTVGMHDAHLEALALKRGGNGVHALLGAAEHEHAPGVPGFDEMGEQAHLLALHHGHKALLHRVGRLAGAGNLDEHGVVQHRGHALLDVARDGGREQQGLARAGKPRHNLAHAGPKAHVEHAVGLVEHENLHVRQVDFLALHEVDESAGRGHEHVAARLEALELTVVALAADDRGDALARDGAKLVSHSVNLLGKLAGGRDDEGTRGDLALCGLAHKLKHRQRERAGLARARLRRCHDVAPLEHDGDGLRLHRRGIGEAQGGYTLE